jgi:replicative DNA helicase
VNQSNKKGVDKGVNATSNNAGRGLRKSVDSLAHGSIPESLPAEAAVLGSMLIDPECIGQVVEKLEVGDFYRTEHQLIFEALIALYEKNKGEGLDGVLLRDELEKRKQLETVGGVEYLGKIIDSVPSSANVMYYVGIVKDKNLLREIIQATNDILNDAYDETGETNEKLDRAEQKIFAVTNKKVSGSASALKDLVVQAYESIESREGGLITGISTGFNQLDDMTCGFQRGDMIIIAGRPSMGKTSLALNIAEHIGIKEKKPVAIFSLEMGKQQLAERFLCSNSKVDSQAVRRGMLGTADFEELVRACSVFSEADIYIDDTPSLTPLELRGKARRLKSQYDIQCLILDYLQLMSMGSGRIESRQQEITSISRYIKALGRELNIPVIVLSQLNRSPEGRENHRPRMSDLRESGSIEQDADVVILLHRDDYYHRKNEEDFTPTNKAEVIVAKQRNGPTGTIELMFVEKLTRFETVALHVEEPF